uniref:Uncharacterized protein n=1 Tax=Tanacetum cinerariifolium TaxID=118510 RepID=A0A699GGG6_TANCI|nr:hypothetical protein [Tanacetum cinerariifolium]
MQTKTSKENSSNKLNALQSTIQHLSSSNYSMYNNFRDAFHRLFKADGRTFKTVLSRNMQNLERKLNKETLYEKDSNSNLHVIKMQFELVIHSKLLDPSNYNSYDLETRRDFKEYTQMKAQTFKETIIQHMNSIEQFSDVHHVTALLDDEYVTMTHSYFIQYTQQAILEFCDTLIQHFESVKKSIDEKSQHKKEYDSWVNERQMQTTEEKVDMSKALDVSLVDKESSMTESKEQDTCSRSGNNTHADDADIRPIYNEEPMTEVQMTAKINVFAIGQQHTEQPEFNNKGEVDKNAKKCHDTYLLLAILTDNQTPKHSYQTLESKNICLKKTVA